MTGAPPLRIGALELAAPVVLAPMAGVTDHAFRTLCRSFGPGLLYVSEMITARALVEGNRFALGTPFSIGRDQITPLRPRTVRLGFDASF